MKLTESVVVRGVKSFPNGSAPGPSGLRPSHLREAVGCPSPDRSNRLISSLTAFINALASGQTPLPVRPYLCGATLLASPKKSGGLRPIAVGEVLRRLTSKCLAITVRSEVYSVLTPLQLGVCVKGGCEAIIHATSHLMSSFPTDQRWTLLLDFSNTFNSVDPEAMFAEFREHIPSLSAWMESCYSCQPHLLLGKETIRSCCGVQQGDPLGPLGFALTLHPIVERIQAEVPGLTLNAWYLDDGTLAGSPEDLAAALNIVERDGPALGLHLNRAKSSLFIPSEADADRSTLPPDITVTRRGFSLLGCPIGPPDFCEEVFQKRVTKVKENLRDLRGMADSQLETTLLRSCLALPKVAFVLRACPPSHTRNTAEEFDSTIQEALEGILGGPMSDWSWYKASLPCSRGGLGLRSAVLHAPAAFLDFSLSTKSLVGRILRQPPVISPHSSSAVAALAVAANRSDWECLGDIDVPIWQRALSNAIDEASHNHLISSAPSTRSRALVLSTGLPHASDWLNVVPSSTLGLHLLDREFWCCLCYWLGVPLHNSQYTCPGAAVRRTYLVTIKLAAGQR